MTDIEWKAFENFLVKQDLWTQEEVISLNDALDNYIVWKPSPQVKAYIESHPHEPLQVVRDRKIVDQLVTNGGMSVERAVGLWSDWEDYEFEIRESARAKV